MVYENLPRLTLFILNILLSIIEDYLHISLNIVFLVTLRQELLITLIIFFAFTGITATSHPLNMTHNVLDINAM